MTSTLDANLLLVHICSGVYLHSHDENLHTIQIYTCVKNIHMCKSCHVNDPLNIWKISDKKLMPNEETINENK